MRTRFHREDETDAWARAVHRTKRLWFLGIFGNLLLLGLMLGLPYARGLLRAQAIRAGYAQALACLLHGTAAKEPGLLPVTDQAARFAASMLKHDAGWLKRCDRALAKLAPSAALFVWPPAKEGEARVREAVQILRSELSTIATRRTGERLPLRPLRALEQLENVLAQHATLAGGLNVPPQPAVTFAEAPRHPTPARLPIYAGIDAVLTLWGNDGELFAVGVDRTGVSYLHADQGGMQRARHVRPKLLQSFLRDGDDSFLAYAVSEQKCRERVGGCSGKSVGLARATLPLTDLPAPRWLASHPAARLDRSLHRAGAQWLLAAQTAGGDTELRRFTLPDSLGDENDALVPPAPLTSAARLIAEQLLFVSEDVAPIVLGTQVRDGDGVLFRVSDDADSELGQDAPRPVLATIPNADAAWAVACSHAGTRGFALGSGRELLLGNLAGDATRVWQPVALEVTLPFHEREPLKDAVLRMCVPTGAVAFAKDAQQRLWSVRCAVQGTGCERQLVSESVAGFAAIRAEKSLVLAYAGSAERAQILLQRYDLEGRALGPAQVPSACWSPKGGMCGQPHLALIGVRLVLTAREGTDLVMLESPDEGRHWEPLAHDGQVHL